MSDLLTADQVRNKINPVMERLLQKSSASGIPVNLASEPAPRSCYDCEHAMQIEGYAQPFFTWCTAPQLAAISYGEEGSEMEPCMVMRDLRITCGFEGSWYQRRDPEKVMNSAYLYSLGPGQESDFHSRQSEGNAEQDSGL